jgi:uncharacterized Fe-S cluster-containing radical SAM superfamily protein
MAIWPLCSYLELAALETAPACARLHAKFRLAEWGLSVLVDDVKLVVSELVTNSLLAPPELEESPALIRLWLLGSASELVVVVWDGSRQPPELAHAPAMAENGRGIWIISKLSTDWGWYGCPDLVGKCVWAEFGIPDLTVALALRGYVEQRTADEHGPGRRTVHAHRGKDPPLMTTTDLPIPGRRDGYGHARTPRQHTAPQPTRIGRVEYGRFRNVYLHISEACQLRCQHCYMGERLTRASKMTLPQIVDTLTTWRRMGGSKLTILGGEPTLHPDFAAAVHAGRQLAYEQVITTTNGQAPARRKLSLMQPADFAYIQVSLDGGSPDTNDGIRGTGTFGEALTTIANLTARGFDARIICTVNRANISDALRPARQTCAKALLLLVEEGLAHLVPGLGTT